MFILASSSVYRLKQLHQLGIFPETRSPDIDETPLENESPKFLAERLALKKASKVEQQLKDETFRYIIGSDQVASFDDTILGKPVTKQRAEEQLKICSGKHVNFYTTVCLIDRKNNQNYQYTDTTTVKFRSLSIIEINQYIEAESPLDCAGSFKCEGLGISLFEAIKTEDPSALIGLPLIGLNSLLLESGFNCILTKPQ
ncbi:MAG: septum formation protein Maf [Gammaproteobacteria bacterium]|nr:septum formation protein Maf [Gammaproteobacteria bacterium]